MPCTPDDFPDLTRRAALEIARQINAGEPDASALTPTGFGWALALEIQRQMHGGGNAGLLFKLGLPARTAKALAKACDEAFERREAARIAALKPGPNAGKTFHRQSYRATSPTWFW